MGQRFVNRRSIDRRARGLSRSAPAGATIVFLLFSMPSVAFAQTADNAGNLAGAQLPAGARVVNRADGSRATDGQTAAPDTDIVVTAQRRTETLQRVPASIEVVTGAQLQTAHINNLVNLQELSPSLVVSQGATPSLGTFTIRGIGTSVSDLGFEQSVGVYIDGVFRGKPAAALQDLIDIDRVEVLRGPQSTLFGRNNAAGAINITTLAPSADTFGVYGEATYGNYNDIQTRLSTNIPLVAGKLAVRIAGYESYRDGFVKAPNLPRGDIDARDRQGVRGQLLWTPTDRTRVRLILDYSHFNDRCCAYLPLFISDAAASPPFNPLVSGNYLGFTAPTPGVRGPSPSDPSNPGTIFRPFDRRTLQDTPSFERTSDKGGSLEVDQEAGPLTFTAIGAYRRDDSLNAVDADGTDSAVFNAQSGTDTRINERSVEGRVQNATGSRVEFVAGVYYFDQDITSRYYAPATIKPIALILPFYDTTSKGTARSGAVFGQATYNLTGTLRVTGGLRYLREKKTSDVTVAPGTFSFPGNFARTDNALMGNATIAYQPSRAANLYFRYARGFKSGGINLIITQPPALASPSVRPETTDAFEVGAKLRFLNGKLSTNLAAYTQTIRDQQVEDFDAVTTTYVTVNAAKARSRGVEAEVLFHPVPPITLSFNGNYLDAKYLSFPGAPSQAGSALLVQDLTGRTTPNAPHWTLIGGISFDQSISRTVQVVSNVSLRHATGYYTDLPLTTAFHNGNTNFLDASVEFKLSNGFGLQFWGRNLTKQDAYLTGIGAPVSNGSLLAFPNDPRTYGVTLRFRH